MWGENIFIWDHKFYKLSTNEFPGNDALTAEFYKYFSNEIPADH